MAEASVKKDATANAVDWTAAAALTSGEVVQQADGHPSAVAGLAGFAAGDKAAAQINHVFEVAKTAGVVCLKGGNAYWVRSTSKVTPLKASGDFWVGTFAEDAASADTTARVAFSRAPAYKINLGDFNAGTWSTQATNGLGVTQPAGQNLVKLAFDAVTEAAMAAVYSDDGVDIDDGPILEARVAIYDKGDNAALDFDFGLADAYHATDFSAVNESIGFHFDGNSLNINAQCTAGDDSLGGVSSTDTTVDAVDDTYAEYWIDARDPEDVALYVNGVRVLSATTFDVSDFAGPLLAIAEGEKTSDDTPFDARFDYLRVRTCDV